MNTRTLMLFLKNSIDLHNPVVYNVTELQHSFV